jgi:3-oxoacyl-[acyl-carrier protein] reductase
MRLKDKVAIVTGSASGIGREIAKRLAQEGAAVAVADINQDAGMKVVEEIRAGGGAARFFSVDVTKRDAVQEFVRDVNQAFGRIDILVNNAGVTRYRPFASMDDADWNAVLDLDLKGVFYCAQAVANYMTSQRYGMIVNISSSLGTGSTPHATAGSPGGSSAYAAAKAGVIQLTKTLARELGPGGVNVNCVAPGFFLTPMTGATRTPEEVEEHIAVRTKMAVLNRPGKVSELASAVLFLASDDASFISGHTLYVDGGRTDRM